MRTQHGIQLNSRQVILDRDGVINVDTGYVGNAEDWQPIAGSVEAISALTRAGFRVFVVTNQSGIGRGYYSVEDFHAVQKTMLSAVAKAGGHIEKTYYCPHAPEWQCDCRKPATGLFLALQDEYAVDLTSTVFVGDKQTDLQAGDAIGAQSVLVRTGCGEKTLAELPPLHGYPVFDDLQSVVHELLTLAAQSSS